MEEEDTQEEKSSIEPKIDNIFEDQKLLISADVEQHFIEVVSEKIKGA